MKPVFIIAIVAVAMIGLLIPSAFADHLEVVIGIVDESGFSKSCVDAGCYTPITATVHVGDTVTMTNTDPTGVHTFTSGTVNPYTYAPSPDGTFDSGVLMAGDSFEWIPENAGIYPYYDMLHTWMIGTIIVQEEDKERNYDTPDEFIEKTIPEEKTPSEVVEKSKFKKYSNNKYNFGFMYPSEFNSHFKGVDSIPMIWKNDPHPELPGFKVWKTVKTIPEGLFATTYEFKVFSDNGMSEYSQSELPDLFKNSSINLLTDACSPENCTILKTDSNISTNNNGAKILDIIVRTVTNYEKGVTQYITSSIRITILNSNNDILMIQHTTSSSDNFTHLFYEPHFTHIAKSLETQYIPKDSLKNTSTIFTAYGETAVTPENGVEEHSLEFVNTSELANTSVNVRQCTEYCDEKSQSSIIFPAILIVVSLAITIPFIIKKKRSKKSVMSSSVKGSQGNIPTDIDKQIAINEEKIRKIEEESKKLDERD
jgi:plastocyanin